MQNSSFPGTRRGLLLTLLVLGVVTILIVVPSQFRPAASVKTGEGLFTRTSSADDGMPNYDIRTAKDVGAAEFFAASRQSVQKDAALVADVRDGFVRGEQELKSRIPTVQFEYNEDIRIPEVITPDVWKARIEWLTPASTGKRSEILRSFVKENNSLIGVSDAQADGLKVTQDYTNPDGNLSYAMLEQRINGVPVFRGEIKAGFTKSGQVIRVINNLAPGLEYGSLSTDFSDPANAVKAAARHINFELPDVSRNAVESTDLKSVFGSGDWATTAEKMYFPTEPGVAVPAWRVLIWQPVNAYYVIVDAASGTMLWRKNIVNDQTQTATYNIYRNASGYIDVADSPAPLSPGPVDPTLGTQGVVGTRSNSTLIGNEGSNSFNNNGWITDGANVTDGNAVEAGIDRVAPNGVDLPLQAGSPNRVFDAPTWNPPPGNPGPGDDPLTLPAQRGAVIQMFYVMNRYHDELYKRGFTEAAFNFQNDNFGRGGAGVDRVSAEGQDSSNTNNANFATPADGGRGRMQMFLWTGPTPDYDGTADAEVIIHEVTHGTSNRLHGNSTGLSTNMGGGMGEGWSDWYAETMLAEPTDPINGIYTTGGYATYLITAGFTGNYYYGIRRFPRAPITLLGTNGRPHNPFTFKYLNAGCAALVDGSTSAFPRGPIGVAQCDQVHNAGEVWSSLLWEVRNRMVARLGFAAGTTKVLQIVTDGMKLAPLGPTFIQERNAIIAAAAALPIAPEASADVIDVREGFRVRGMGFSASIQTASPAAVTEAFDFPNIAIVDPFSVSDSTGDNDGFPEPGESVLLSVSITNTTGAPITGVQANVNGGPNVSYGTINDGQTVAMNIPYLIPGGSACGSLHQVTINASSSVGAQLPVVKEFRLGVPVGGAPATFTNSTALTIPGTGTGPGASAPYGTTVTAAGLTGNKTIRLTLTNLSHTFPADIDMLLVGPGGQKFIVMSDAAGALDVVGATVNLADSAATIIPATDTPLAGTWRPTDQTAGDTFAVPAPAAPYLSPAAVGSATFATAFGSDATTMNGIWTLYVMDDAGADIGTLAGWSLTFESNDYACTAAAVRSRADFDGDGKTDLSVFRPSEGNWYLNRSTAGFLALHWGASGDVLVPGDFDGDGKTDTAIFRANADATQPDFFVLNSNGFTVSGISWGIAGDVPVTADYDGDSKTDVAVFRPSNNTWYVLKSGGGFTSTAFGQAGDVPVVANFNNDALADLTVYRAGVWITQLSGGGILNFVHGSPGDILVPADYDGDNIDDHAVYRPSTGTWIINNSNGGTITNALWGNSTDIPVPGDYDGDGKDDVAIYRNGQWWLNRSTAGVSILNFGVASDIAVPRRYLP